MSLMAMYSIINPSSFNMEKRNEHSFIFKQNKQKVFKRFSKGFQKVNAQIDEFGHTIDQSQIDNELDNCVSST